MFWMIKEDADVPSDKRREIAQEMLDTPLTELDVNTRKIRQMCYPDVVIAATQGTNSLMLDTILRTIGQRLQPDVQDVEGINSLLKMMGKRSPNMSAALLSSRVAIKKSIGKTDRVSRWTQVKGTAGQVIQAATSAASLAQEMVKDSSHERFMAPPPLEDLPTDASTKKAMARMFPWLRHSDAQVWALVKKEHSVMIVTME